MKIGVWRAIVVVALAIGCLTFVSNQLRRDHLSADGTSTVDKESDTVVLDWDNVPQDATKHRDVVLFEAGTVRIEMETVGSEGGQARSPGFKSVSDIKCFYDGALVGSIAHDGRLVFMWPRVYELPNRNQVLIVSYKQVEDAERFGNFDLNVHSVRNGELETVHRHRFQAIAAHQEHGVVEKRYELVARLEAFVLIGKQYAFEWGDEHDTISDVQVDDVQTVNLR